MSDAYMPESKSSDWGTPWRTFRPINDEFHFTVDVAASDWNAKHERYFTPEINGLQQPWVNEVAWCNPPYGSKNIDRWLTKARWERESGTTTVLLLPNTTDCERFHRQVWDVERNRPREGIELRFIQGRIQFEIPPELRATTKVSANVKGSILVIVRPHIISVCPTRGR